MLSWSHIQDFSMSWALSFDLFAWLDQNQICLVWAKHRFRWPGWLGEFQVWSSKDFLRASLTDCKMLCFEIRRLLGRRCGESVLWGGSRWRILAPWWYVGSLVNTFPTIFHGYDRLLKGTHKVRTFGISCCNSRNMGILPPSYPQVSDKGTSLSKTWESCKIAWQLSHNGGSRVTFTRYAINTTGAWLVSCFWQTSSFTPMLSPNESSETLIWKSMTKGEFLGTWLHSSRFSVLNSEVEPTSSF